MSEIKRGVVMLLQAGDPEITQAGDPEITQPLKGGILAGRAKQLETRQEQPAEVNWGEVAQLVKVAVGNTKGAEDYAILRAAAAQEYRMPKLSELARVREKLLAIYAMVFVRIRDYFNWEEPRWRGN